MSVKSRNMLGGYCNIRRENQRLLRKSPAYRRQGFIRQGHSVIKLARPRAGRIAPMLRGKVVALPERMWARAEHGLKR